MTDTNITTRAALAVEADRAAVLEAEESLATATANPMAVSDPIMQQRYAALVLHLARCLRRAKAAANG